MEKISQFFGILLVLGCFVAHAQTTRYLDGRVYSADNDISGTHVLNISLQRATITDANGFFTIPVRFNDTLVFSAVQFKRKEIVVGPSVLESTLLYVPLEDILTELDEVVVRPYNLSGELGRDMRNLDVDPVVTAASLGLPNAYVRVKTQNERKLFEADNGNFIIVKFDSLFYMPLVLINLNKILNRVTGRTQKLKKFVALDQKIDLLETVRQQFPDSIYVQELKIPVHRLEEFMYFCEADSLFRSTVEMDDQIRLWEFLSRKGADYRKNNALD